MTPVLNVTMDDCNNDDGGIFKNGFDAALSTVMNYFYMQQLDYNSMDPELRTDAYLGVLLADPKSIDYMMTYIKYFDGTFASIKAAVTGSFQEYYDLKTSQFSAVYSIFIIVLVVSIIVILCFLMRSLQ